MRSLLILFSLLLAVSVFAWRQNISECPDLQVYVDACRYYKLIKNQMNRHNYLIVDPINHKIKYQLSASNLIKHNDIFIIDMNDGVAFCKLKGN